MAHALLSREIKSNFLVEPTTQWDTLHPILSYARTHPNRQGRRIEFIITTNGIGLTKERAKQLSAPDVLVLFSLDGDAETHRRFRPTYRGKTIQTPFAAPMLGPKLNKRFSI